MIRFFQRNFSAIFTFIILSFTAFSLAEVHEKPAQNSIKPKNDKVSLTTEKNISSVYDSLHLEAKGLTQPAFDYAIKSYSMLKKKGLLDNDSIITIVDFDQPSYKKRMYIIDIKHYKVIFNTWTAHGKNTGTAIAKNFSNTPNSLKSSLGVYITDETYMGKHGYSLRLIGLEKCNSSTFDRAIVVHGASYVSQKMINNQGYIGRSFGCPAVPEELSKPIIDKIKGRSCFFIYNSSYRPSILV